MDRALAEEQKLDKRLNKKGLRTNMYSQSRSHYQEFKAYKTGPRKYKSEHDERATKKRTE